MSGRSIQGSILKNPYGNLLTDPLRCNTGMRKSFSFTGSFTLRNNLQKGLQISSMSDISSTNKDKSPSKHQISHTIWYIHHTPFEVYSCEKPISYASIIPPTHLHVRDCNLIPEEPRFAPSCSSKLRPSPKSRDERGFWTSAVSLWIMMENKGLTNDPLACRSSRMMSVSGIMAYHI